ncbi:putative aldouronate transport system substrate-binding protein [Microbacterium sp. SORGH_AS 1204]|uniref:extracellular solute-binding protein n=1 Tax=Microbacterium sp. SORGH_AS_1204 TaxID=3041785 RepID=UPI00278E6401|nr:extracellular solute-binding protein [Microbacterium sp. SORGH_AS_1204]MDQ1138151.1 putative aldouronate transport system substrate-binding protein [Microbacterium sp. SORGH_AS_1204]
MRSSRALMGIIGVTAAAVSLAGCTAGGGATATGDGTAFSYRIPDRFKNWLADNKWNQPLQDGAGVQVNVVDGGPEKQHYQQLDLLLSSGDLEDATVATISQAQVYGTQGAFLNLAPLIESDAPNLKAYIDEHPDFKSLITNDDGSIYGLINEYPTIGPVTFYRDDMFAAAGITTPPASVEEYTAALETLKAKYGATDSSYYPLGGRDSFLNYQYAFAANDGIDDSGTVHGIYQAGRGTDIHSDGARDMIEWYSTLYNQGLIDPEWVKGAVSEEDWQTKMLTGKISISNDFFTRPQYFLANADEATYPDYSIGTMPALSNGGEQMKVPANEKYNTDRVFVVNAKTQNSKAIIEFLDYLYSDEGQDIYHYGVEGESYDVVNGEKEYTVSYAENADQEVGTPVWNFAQDRLTYPAPVDDDAFYKWQGDFTKSFAADYFSNDLKTSPVLKYTAEQQEERSKLLASVQPFVDAEIVKFVTGARPLSEWDSFLSDADAQGYAQITEIDQAAADAMK